MNNPPNIFLSFSTIDMKYVNELMAVLKYQGVDVWDFSSITEAIEAGTFIEEKLKSEINNKEVFISLVSNNSISEKTGRYTRLETRHALEMGKMIIPIVLPGTIDPPWPEPYYKLQSILYLKFDFRDDKEFARNLYLLCSKLGIEFQPLDKSHPKLPFWSFFRSEIFEIPKSNYHYGMLMSVLWSFNKCFFNKDWVEAEKRISLFIQNCEYLVPDYKMFYPHIVHAVCLRHLSRFDEAEARYIKAKANRPGYGEENIYGGLAGVYFEKNEFERSFQNFKKSLKAAPDGLNEDEKFNFVVASLFTDREVNAELSGFVLRLNPEGFGQEVKYLYNAKAYLLFLDGQFFEAIKMLRFALEEKHFDENTFLFYTKFILFVLEKVKKGDKEFLAVLRNIAPDAKEENVLDFLINMIKHAIDVYIPGSGKLRRQLMELSKKRGNLTQAKTFFETYILKESNSREELIEYALLLYHTGDKKAALLEADKVLSMSKKCLPLSHRELYFEGFAHYILEQKDFAKLCYSKSNLDMSYYDSFFTDLFLR